MQVLEMYLHYYCHHQYIFIYIYMRERNVGLLCCSPKICFSTDVCNMFSWTFLIMLIIIRYHNMIFDAIFDIECVYTNSLQSTTLLLQPQQLQMTILILSLNQTAPKWKHSHFLSLLVNYPSFNISSWIILLL